MPPARAAPGASRFLGSLDVTSGAGLQLRIDGRAKSVARGPGHELAQGRAGGRRVGVVDDGGHGVAAAALALHVAGDGGHVAQSAKGKVKSGKLKSVISALIDVSGEEELNQFDISYENVSFLLWQ